jgi:arabinofuranan 3-O-arabinosyltransferase
VTHPSPPAEPEASTAPHGTGPTRGSGHPSGSWRPLWAVAALCYLPFLLTRPGWVSADTKSYLYLDPGALLDKAWSMWDPGVGLGTVSHQTIGYLWPMGPWFWTFDALGVPDWVAQRLWWGTLLFAAISGVAYLLRLFRLPALAVWPAALAYGLSPYAVAYLGRLSGVLLPAIGLPWLLGLTISSIRVRSWRHPALFALVVATVGSVNLTALALVGVAPLLWVLFALVSREAPPRRILGAVARIGLLATLTSAWWLAGLTVQATHGIDIVRYSESAEVVARTSTAFEVVRGLGYWFFYGGDKLELWIEPSFQYTQRALIFAITFVVPVAALLGAAVGRWRHRTYFASLFVVGVLLAVGAHPWSDPSPLGRLIKVFLGTERGLAFRSLPRAVPLVALAAAALVAGALAWTAGRRPRVARPVAAVVVLASVLGMVPLWQRSIVQDSLARREVPDYWLDAADLIDERDDGTRVLEIPGSDFASYRWGNTVDPITPGLVERPYVARELVPYGTPMSADLLNSLDLRLQERTLEPESLAPLARLLRAGDLVIRGDLQFERYNLARPRLVWRLVQRAPGLSEPIPLTGPTANRPIARLPMHDEVWLLQEQGLDDSPAVAVVPVDDVPTIVDLKPAEGAVLLSGDGAGIVDAAAAELIDGTELIRYSASLDPDEVAAELDRGASLVVTDGNRKRGERWGSLRHTRGHTERVDETQLAENLTDNRLPRFPDAGSDVQTVAIQRGGIQVDATSYGNPITFAADGRPALAVDGDLETAWATAAFSDARGERIVLTLDEPLDLDHLDLFQLPEVRTTRAITRVRVDVGDGRPVEVDLGASSRLPPGQRVDLGPRTTSRIEITILADNLNEPMRYGDAGPVGFTDIGLGGSGPVLDEIIRMPVDLVDAMEAADSDAARAAALTYVMTRLRQDPTDRTREDEERGIARLFRVPAARTFSLSGTARLSGRAADPILDDVLGVSSPDLQVTSSLRLSGSRIDRASAALDGDLTTSWRSAFGRADGESITVTTAEPRVFDHLDLVVVADGVHSVPTALVVKVDGRVVATPTLPEVADGEELGHTVAVPVDLPPTTGSTLEVEVDRSRTVSSVDWTSVQPIDHPFAIAELGIDGLEVPAAAPTFDDRCRDDLVTVDGEAVSVRVVGSTVDALAGEPLGLEVCGGTDIDLAAGDHEVHARPGVRTGIDVDQLVLTAEPADGAASAGVGEADPEGAGELTVLASAPDHVRVSLDGLTPGEPVWLILGQSHTDGWTATSATGGDLGPSQLVDGFANGWLVVPDSTTLTVDLDFAPQRRVDVGLAVSALGAAACLVLVARRPRAVAVVPPGLPGLRDPLAGRPAVRPVALAVGVGVAIGAVLVVPPVVALVLGLAAGLGTRRRRLRIGVALLPAALVGAAALYGFALLVRYYIAPGVEWVHELERLHPIALAGVVALAVDVVVDAVWRRDGWPGFTRRASRRGPGVAAFDDAGQDPQGGP